MLMSNGVALRTPSGTAAQKGQAASSWLVNQSCSRNPYNTQSLTAAPRLSTNNIFLTPFFLLSVCPSHRHRLPGRKLPASVPDRPGRSSPPPQWIHLCVQRLRVNEGRRLEPSPQLSETLTAASVLVFAAAPRDQDRFFWSPQRPKVSCSPWWVEERKRKNTVGIFPRLCALFLF